MKTTEGKRTNEHREVENFPIQDSVGRVIGARIYTFETDFVELPETARMWNNMDAGHYFGLNTWATRNGTPYGAIQQNQYFTTAQERSIAIAKYLVGAQRRAVKRMVATL